MKTIDVCGHPKTGCLNSGPAPVDSITWMFMMSGNTGISTNTAIFFALSLTQRITIVGGIWQHRFLKQLQIKRMLEKWWISCAFFLDLPRVSLRIRVSRHLYSLNMCNIYARVNNVYRHSDIRCIYPFAWNAYRMLVFCYIIAQCPSCLDYRKPRQHVQKLSYFCLVQSS